MSTPRASTDGSRRVSRNIPLPRRVTRGPLDDALDPLSTSHVEPTSTSATAPPEIAVATQEEPTTSSTDVGDAAIADLYFLQDERAYHKVPRDDVPQSFLASSRQPPLGASLRDLLDGGHFRRAADTAVDDLLTCPPSQPRKMLQLLYCRLACLVLISQHEMAAAEGAMLYNYLSGSTTIVAEVAKLCPWELRVLLVRLQSFSGSDGGRRGIMAIYGLASEVRLIIRTAKDETTITGWEQRLAELGLLVSDGLVETGELETACRHLDSLTEGDQGEIAARKAMIYIQTGNLMAARSCIACVNDEHLRLILETLTNAAQSDPEDGLRAWQNMGPGNHRNQLIAQNEAIYLLYTGRMQEAQTAMEKLLDAGSLNSTLLFNLSTMYELRSDKSTTRKLQMAAMLAEKSPNSVAGGWERSNGELKL